MATIKLKHSTTSSAVPTTGELQAGELALNIADGTIHFENAAGNAVFSFDVSQDYLPLTGGTLTGDLIIGKTYTSGKQPYHALYIGGEGLGSTDAAIYMGNRGDGTGYGWELYYAGTGSGTANDFRIVAENLGSPVTVLDIDQSGNAHFPVALTVNSLPVTRNAGTTGVANWFNIPILTSNDLYVSTNSPEYQTSSGDQRNYGSLYLNGQWGVSLNSTGTNFRVSNNEIYHEGNFIAGTDYQVAGNYEPADAAITKSDETEAITQSWTFTTSSNRMMPRFYESSPLVQSLSDNYQYLDTVPYSPTNENRMQFYLPTTAEVSTNNGSSWSAAPFTTDQLKSLMMGRHDGTSIDIANGAYTNIRFTWDYGVSANPNGYVFLKFLHIYTANKDNTTQYRVERRDFTSQVWSDLEPLTSGQGGWPTHISIPHANTSFLNSAGRYDAVRIQFDFNWSGVQNIQLFNINWYGTYPAARHDNVYFWDRQGDFWSTKNFRVGSGTDSVLFTNNIQGISLTNRIELDNNDNYMDFISADTGNDVGIRLRSSNGGITTRGYLVASDSNGGQIDLWHGNSEIALRAIEDGGTYLYYNGSSAAYTQSYGLRLRGSGTKDSNAASYIRFDDSNNVQVGTIGTWYGDSVNSFGIRNVDGNVWITANRDTAASANVIIETDNSSGTSYQIATFNGGNTQVTFNADLVINQTGNDFAEGLHLNSDTGSSPRLMLTDPTATSCILQSGGNLQFRYGATYGSGSGTIAATMSSTGNFVFNGSTTLNNNTNYMNGHIYHNGDTNTFFGFPSNDTFNVTTGGNERFRVGSNGIVEAYLGGGVNPAFHASTSGSHIQVGATGGGMAAVIGSKQNTAAAALDYGAYIAYDSYWDDAADAWKAKRTNLGRKWMTKLGGYHTNEWSINYYDGVVSGSWADADWTELFKVEAAGPVTTAGSLTVGDTINVGRLRDRDTGNTIYNSDDNWLRLNPDGDFTSGIYCNSTGVLRHDGWIEAGSGIRHVADGDTNVTFATNVLTLSAGGTALDITTARIRSYINHDFSAGIDVTGDITMSGQLIGAASGHTTIDSNNGFYVRLYYNNSEKFRVGSGRNYHYQAVSIEATAPTLVIKDTDSTGAGQIGYISFQDSGSVEQGYVGFGSSGNTTLSVTNSNAGGNVLISSLATVDINGAALDAKGIGSAYFGDDVRVGRFIYHDGDTNTYLDFVANDQWRVVCSGAERFRVNASGVDVTGNILVTGTVDGVDVAGLQGRSITAGNGLTGGGTLAASRTLNVGAGTGISVAADTVAIASRYSPTTATLLGGSVDLDTLAQDGDAGFYYQNSNANATSGTNYPLNAAGSLLVQRAASSGGYGSTQLYIGYINEEIYVRGMYGSGSANNAWTRVFTDKYHPNADTWTTSRTFTIGSASRAVNGSANLSWTLSQIGALGSSETINVGDDLLAVTTFETNSTSGGLGRITWGMAGGAQCANITPSNAAGSYSLALGTGWTNQQLVITSDEVSIPQGTRLTMEATAGPNMRMYTTSGTGSSALWIQPDTSGAEFYFSNAGEFHADGNITAYSTTTTSDIKLKDNVNTVSSALEMVCNLRGVTFNWKRDGTASAGVIAQEVEQVFPSAVKEVEALKEDQLSYKTVDYNQLHALEIEAIKELKEENVSLKNQIDNLIQIVERLMDKVE